MKHVPGGGRYSTGGGGQVYDASGYANQVLLALDQISFSSRYGGTVALEFDLADLTTPSNEQPHPDDFEYDLGSSEYLFDVANLRATVFVRPDRMQFNPKHPYVRFQTPVFVELEPSGVTAYSRSVGPNAPPERVVVLDEAVRAHLDGVVSAIEQEVAASFAGSSPAARNPVSQLAHAWAHTQHDAIIGPNDEVTRILVSDGWSDVFTKELQPYVLVTWKIDYVVDYGTRAYHEIDNEFEVNVEVYHQYPTPRLTILDETVLVEQGEGHYWMTVGAFTKKEWNALNHIDIELDVVELDPVSDDEYPKHTVELIPDKHAVANQLSLTYYTGWVQPSGLTCWNPNPKRGPGVVQSSFDLSDDRPGVCALGWLARVGIWGR